MDYEARQIAALADGQFISPGAGSTTISEVGARWMESGTRRDSTLKRDRSALDNHILPDLGPNRAVRSVTKADCQQLVDGWSRSGLAPRSVVRLHASMRAMFQYAVDAELILRNPASRIRLPHPDPVARPTLSPEELERLAEELGEVQAVFMWCGAVLVGLRWAEIAGIDLDLTELLAHYQEEAI